MGTLTGGGTALAALVAKYEIEELERYIAAIQG